MPKTGSSSIQDTFAKSDIAPVEYMPNHSANHSGTMMLLFKDKVEAYHSFQSRGKARPQLLEERRIMLDRVTQYFEETTAETVVISAESISALDVGEIAKLAEFLHLQTDDVQVIAYVRPPCSFMNSAFQQMLKNNKISGLKPMQFWPKYKNRFAKIDEVFGRENVTLKPFIRDELKDGNVVQDFAAFLNVSVDIESIVLSNESLSLEATALLYAQRRLGKGMLKGFGRALKINADFIEHLSQIKGRRMTFSRSLVEQTAKVQAADILWIEERLGRDFLDLPDAGAGGISSEADLLDIAAEQQDVLNRMIDERFKTGLGSPHEQAARKLDLVMSSFI